MFEIRPFDQGLPSDQEGYDYFVDVPTDVDTDFSSWVAPCCCQNCLGNNVSGDYFPSQSAPTLSKTRAEAALALTRGNRFWAADADGITRVTYAYRSSIAPGYSTDLSYERTFIRLTEAEILAFETAIQGWADVANIQFVRSGTGTIGDAAYSNNATIVIGRYNKPGGGAGSALNPSTLNRSVSSADYDIWINDPSNWAESLDYLSYGIANMAHEFGHVIGLKHPGDYNAGGGRDLEYDLDAAYIEDNHQYSIMSYFSGAETGANLPGHSSTPRMDDIASVQLKYGANMTTRTGDTVYGFNNTADKDWFAASKNGIARSVNFCVWDAGGTDTFDFSGYYQDQVIKLAAESFSSVGGVGL